MLCPHYMCCNAILFPCSAIVTSAIRKLLLFTSRKLKFRIEVYCTTTVTVSSTGLSESQVEKSVSLSCSCRKGSRRYRANQNKLRFGVFLMGLSLRLMSLGLGHWRNSRHFYPPSLEMEKSRNLFSVGTKNVNKRRFK